MAKQLTHYYAVTLKVVVSIHPNEFVNDEAKLKSVLVENAVDRLHAGGFDPDDIAYFERIETLGDT